MRRFNHSHIQDLYLPPLMPTKHQQKNLNCQTRASKQGVVKSKISPDKETTVQPRVRVRRSKVYEVGDLWNERETEFFRPYAEMLLGRGV